MESCHKTDLCYSKTILVHKAFKQQELSYVRDHSTGTADVRPRRGGAFYRQVCVYVCEKEGLSESMRSMLTLRWAATN